MNHSRLTTCQNFRLIGSGFYQPSNEVSAEEVDQRSNMAPGWTLKHTGIARRYECLKPETIGSMAADAIVAALKNASCSVSSVDALIDCSTCRHQPIPCNAAMVNALLGEQAKGIASFDVNSTCLGFVVGMNVANGLMASAAFNRVVVYCSEAGMAGVNWMQPTSAGLISDGAAAVVLERVSDSQNRIAFRQETYSEFNEVCEIRGGGHLLPFFEHQGIEDPRFRFNMDSKGVVRAAVEHLPPMYQQLLAAENTTPDQLHCIPHQASPRGLKMLRRILKIPRQRFHDHCSLIGNMISVSIPAVLHRVRAEGVIQPGERVLLLGTSAGYSQAGLIFTL